MPKAAPTNGSRFWCFTLNNPKPDDDKQLSDLCASPLVRYLCYGREKGVNETPHYQAYVELTHPQRFSWIKGRIKRAHIEPKRGSRTQARDYCFKEDLDPFEYGLWHPDRQGQRNDLVAVQKKLEDPDESMADIAKEHFEAFCRYNRFFSQYRAMHARRRTEPTKTYIFWGGTGTGKTRLAYELGCFQMDYINGFFTHPRGHERLLFDDIDHPLRLFSRRLFLRITDRYPMEVNIKGGMAHWAPKMIIFTTNQDPDEWNLDAACRRRITQIFKFPLNVCTSAMFQSATLQSGECRPPREAVVSDLETDPKIDSQ